MMEKKPLIQQGWLRVVLLISCLLLLLQIFSIAAERFMEGQPEAGKRDVFSDSRQLTSLFLPVIVSVLTVFLFRKYIDKKSIFSLGFEAKGFLPAAATGFFLSLFILGAGTLILVASQNLRWTDISFDPVQLFLSLGLMIMIAVSEELLFRGYVLNNLMSSANKWSALIISAAVFAIFHINNPGITTVAVFNVFAAGLLLGVNYLFTRNLWFGILLHAAWNFYQGPVLGFKVSGLALPSLLHQDLSGNPLLTGDAFGFEGSLLNGALTVITAGLLAWIYEASYAKAAVGEVRN
jgi:membrane protease YdiL (CAAX protease family)